MTRSRTWPAGAPAHGQSSADSSAPNPTYPSMRESRGALDTSTGGGGWRRSHGCSWVRSGSAVNSPAGVAKTQFAGWHRVADGGIGKR
jgi:hypothetical protein